MLWEVTISPNKGSDQESDRVREEYNLLTHSRLGHDIIAGNAHGYLLEGELNEDQVRSLLGELLVDSLTHKAEFKKLHDRAQFGGTLARSVSEERLPLANASGQCAANTPFEDSGRATLTVLLKPGVMDPVALSVADAAHDLGIPVESVRTFRRYFLNSALTRRLTPLGSPPQHSSLEKVLANDAIERIVEGPLSPEHLAVGKPYSFSLVVVPLRQLDDAGLLKLSRDGQLSLNLAEMQAIQVHFRELGRDPTDVELETLAQTWSEHCSHKTLKGKIDFDGRRIDNLAEGNHFRRHAGDSPPARRR